jgi:hypothetical protein
MPERAATISGKAGLAAGSAAQQACARAAYAGGAVQGNAGRWPATTAATTWQRGMPLKAGHAL